MKKMKVGQRRRRNQLRRQRKLVVVCCSRTAGDRGYCRQVRRYLAADREAEERRFMDREATTFAATNHRSGCVGGVRHGAFRRWWLRRSSPECDMDLLLFFIFVFGREKWWRRERLAHELRQPFDMRNSVRFQILVPQEKHSVGGLDTCFVVAGDVIPVRPESHPLSLGNSGISSVSEIVLALEDWVGASMPGDGN
nr:hypothetical protein Iba_chr09fCG9330 [Ipomoea batatas]